MSAYNVKVKVWTSPKTGEIRIYIDGRFCDFRSVLSHANGYLRTDETGAILWNHAFKAGPGTIRESEMNALAMAEMIKGFKGHINTNETLTFAELVERIAACQTKGGNFSYRQYEKKYVL